MTGLGRERQIHALNLLVVTEIGQSRVEIVGLFNLGTSFAQDGTLVMSDETFLHLDASHHRGIISAGLIKLKAGVNVEQAKAEHAKSPPRKLDLPEPKPEPAVLPPDGAATV